MIRYSPPAFACRLFQIVLPVPYRGALFGDLIEEYNLRAEATSPSTATRWFWGQTCRSIPFIIGSSLRVGDWLISASAAAGVYVVMGLLKFSADFIIAKLITPEPTTYIVLAPIVFLAITSIGGYAAARIRWCTAVVLAVIVMITVAVLIAVKPCPIPVPWWYRFGFLTLGPLSVLLTPVAFGFLRLNSEESAT
jgi:hypothetical protein